MTLANFVSDFAILPSFLIAAATSWYYGEIDTAVGFLVALAITLYLTKIFSTNQQELIQQQHQIDSQQAIIMEFTGKVNELVERLNETLKRTNDNHIHLENCQEELNRIKEDL